MRGLKQKRCATSTGTQGRIFYRCVDWNISAKRISRYLNVASFTDAWIETHASAIFVRASMVASFTDAWIETRITYQSTPGCWSHLLQMRGLKLNILAKISDLHSRIFYRCVDWNLPILLVPILSTRRIFYRCVDWNTLIHAICLDCHVASFTDAWIETCAEWYLCGGQYVASFTDAWIETEM